jgi:tetratricopeptide (TPR) repeat protein
MIRCWHVITLVFIALCCASTPAFSQGRRAGPRPTEALGPYILQSEEEARRREEAADLSDRVSRVEGRLQAMGKATEQMAMVAEQAARASGEAARAAGQVLATIDTGTKLLAGLIALLSTAVGFLLRREVRGIEAMRERADEAVRRAEEERQKAMEARQQAEESGKAAQDQVQIIDNLRKRAEAAASAAAKVDLTTEVSAKDRGVLEDASRRADLLEDLGEELTPEVHVARGNDFYSRGDYERAINEYEQALGRDPDYADAHVNKGAALLELDRYEEVLPPCDRAIELDPADAFPYWNRACAYSRLGKRDEALDDLRKAIELQPTWRETARTDEDFASLRGDPNFRKLVGLEEEEAGS